MAIPCFTCPSQSIGHTGRFGEVELPVRPDECTEILSILDAHSARIRSIPPAVPQATGFWASGACRKTCPGLPLRGCPGASPDPSVRAGRPFQNRSFLGMSHARRLFGTIAASDREKPLQAVRPGPLSSIPARAAPQPVLGGPVGRVSQRRVQAVWCIPSQTDRGPQQVTAN